MKTITSREFEQRGAASAATLFFLIVVISLFLITAMKMTSRSNADTSAHAEGIEALYLAESALERVRYRLTAGTSCTALGNTVDNVNYTFSRGTFRIISGTLVSASKCSVVVAGTVTVGNIATQRRIAAEYETGAAFIEPFPSSASFTTNWATTFGANNQGTVTWNNGGWFHARTNGGGTKNSRMDGYSQRTIPTLSTGPSPRDVYLSFDYTKFTQGSFASDRFDLGIDLYDSTQMIATNIWSHTSVASMTTSFTSVVNRLVTLPANRNYDKVRITFNFDENAKRQMNAYVDNLSISFYWDLTSWKEVDQ